MRMARATLDYECMDVPSWCPLFMKLPRASVISSTPLNLVLSITFLAVAA
jgi:hypothetical protein